MRWFHVILLVLLLPLAACGNNRMPGTYPVDTSGPYTLDSGDVLRVIVYGDDTLSDTYLVDDGGNLSFPLIGPTPVRGLTTEQAAARLAASLTNGYLRNPNVSAEIAEYRPFYIQGEVEASGAYPYAPRMTARAAISLAGGFTETAERSRVIVYRPDGNQMIKGTVELDFPIMPGDTIVVMDRWL